jgi:hypothetical protein
MLIKCGAVEAECRGLPTAEAENSRAFQSVVLEECSKYLGPAFCVAFKGMHHGGILHHVLLCCASDVWGTQW